MQQTIPFKVHPRAIKELGERLVTDDFVALNELIKNSYDAMASEVHLRFGEDANGQYIEVEDNGDGMSLEIIRDVWTVLFTPYKKVLSLKRKNPRKLSGEKGIGRLSAARLGRELEIFTKEQNGETYQLLMDWDSLDQLDPDDKFNMHNFSEAGVIVDVATISPFADTEHGTLIRITRLRRSDWIVNHESFDEVVSELSRIRPPLRSFDDFKIYVQHPNFAPNEICISGPQPKFLDYPHYFFSGEVDGTGFMTSTLKVRKGGVNEIRHPKKDLVSDGTQTACGPFKFEFRVWDLDSDSIGEISHNNDLSRAEVRKIIKLNKGVSLYRDGILVLPKTSGVDWLNLEQRRVQRVGDKISSANIVAFVDISQEQNPEIKDTADREALERNQASNQLVSLLHDVIEALEFERKKFKTKKEDRFTFYNLFAKVEVQSSIELVKETLSKENNTIALKQIEKLEAQLKERDDVLAERLGYYSRLASVGTIASYMVHEVKNSSTAISACNRDGRKVLEDCESKEKSLLLRRLDISDKAISSLESISDAMLPLSGAKFKRKPGQKTNLKRIVENCIDANKKMIDLNNVDVQHSGLDLDLAVSEGELFILLQNLLQNAIYWLSKNNKSQNIINIKAFLQEDKFVSIFFDDSGMGIQEELLEDIFLPGVSTKKEGTGMGLAVVAEICEKYSGSVFAGNSAALGGASFKIRLPTE